MPKFKQMKRIFLIMLTVFLNLALFSCTPEDDNEYQERAEIEACCGEEGDVTPPPPPPPPSGE